jgi:hypothetical protein
MRERVASTLVRPAHDLHGVFNMAPSSGQLHLAVRFKLDGILGSLRYGAGTVRFQQLPGIGMDFDFSHGVILLLSGSTVTRSRQKLQMLTPTTRT